MISTAVGRPFWPGRTTAAERRTFKPVTVFAVVGIAFTLLEAYVASPRALVSAGTLITMGLSMRDAAIAAIVGPLTDEPSIRSGPMSMVDVYLGGPPTGPARLLIEPKTGGRYRA
jgi:hypothetical protein